MPCGLLSEINLRRKNFMTSLEDIKLLSIIISQLGFMHNEFVVQMGRSKETTP